MSDETRCTFCKLRQFRHGRRTCRRCHAILPEPLSDEMQSLQRGIDAFYERFEEADNQGEVA